ncbi:MAG: 30S ribosome-binding factor RbfA [Chloroflexota bacterium]
MSERRRQQRVAEEIKRRASTFIRDELKDPRLGFITVTDVEVNSDLTLATIYVSVMGTPEEKEQSMEALQSAKGVVKRDIGDWLRMRTVPDVRFKLDNSLERGAHIMELIHTLEEER